ncbi:MAG: membrane protein insertion efficiency factor YidD [Ruminiclostridium sp.]|nr:membrane protein insertion efficiency factor YidD [Ruminiclostridium sp.]
MKYILIGLIKLYRITLSKIKPPCCRFYPTCSTYGLSAIRRFGSVKGGYLTVKRICRCNPFSSGGYDPVPDEFYFFDGKKKERKQEI